MPLVDTAAQGYPAFPFWITVGKLPDIIANKLSSIAADMMLSLFQKFFTDCPGKINSQKNI
jgi:hypothetical protein